MFLAAVVLSNGDVIYVTIVICTRIPLILSLGFVMSSV